MDNLILKYSTDFLGKWKNRSIFRSIKNWILKNLLAKASNNDPKEVKDLQ